MTSEVSTETSEFLRRRKLRLQQVREQSKDIAKKIRQRAKLEKLRQVVELDTKKQKDYLKKQDNLVKKLEEYYANGVESVGASHKNALEVNIDDDDQTNKLNITKQRGRQAAAELRRKRQEKLDEQKRILDRKLQARDTANEISREKVISVTNKLTTKSSTAPDTQSKTNEVDTNKNDDDIKHNDMGTQWDLDEMPNEWIPNIPILSLPKDDNDGKESNVNLESKSDKSKRMDLFALSDEMPLSLRGGLATDERAPVKPSLTLVSEYLQNRGLRLRESEKSGSSHKNTELQRLKHTIFRSRCPKEGIDELCHVHDGEIVPMPVWHPETNCKCPNLMPNQLHNNYKVHSNVRFKSDLMSSSQMSPRPVLRSFSPFIRSKVGLKCCATTDNCVEKFSKSMSVTAKSSLRKPSVTIYNHSTRDSRDIPCHDEEIVLRDVPSEEDAYAQALKATSAKKKADKEAKKLQDMRSKVAMTKQSVEKEYRDTINFLNSLPKDDKPIRGAYMNEHRQELQRENRQKKMQDEFYKIQKECKKHTCRNKSRSKSKTPTKEDTTNDFQYSWMPVPESDDNLAIHTIPTSLKEGKSGNSVKFSKVDSYHEYRSRHKHTPPTKETSNVKEKDMENLKLNFSDSESGDSEASSINDLRLEKKRISKEIELSDAEKIVIYKILKSKNEKSSKNKLLKEIVKSISKADKANLTDAEPKRDKATSSDSNSKVTYQRVNEGIYKSVSQSRDNIAAMYYQDKAEEILERAEEESKRESQCFCKTKCICSKKQNMESTCQWESGDSHAHLSPNSGTACQHSYKKVGKPRMTPLVESSNATSATSFKTAATNCNIKNYLPDAEFIKLVDQGGEDAGKFYIGASGFLKDNTYEVVIQLRKKGDEQKDDKEMQPEENEKETLKNNTPEIVSAVDLTPTIDEATNLPKSTVESEVEIRSKNLDTETPHFVSEVSLTPSNDPSIVPTDIQPVRKVVIETKSVEEKGVGTSFIDSFAVPSQVTQSDPVPRPATSTYTQTSETTPNNRPMFFHMSSSTSTAYLSPPDMILPNFLRPDHQWTEDDICDPKNFEGQRVDSQYVTENECKCKKCAKRKSFCKVGSSGDSCRRPHQHQNNAQTPPNTATSHCSSFRKDYYHGHEHHTARQNCKDMKNKNNKCRKCKSRNRVVDNDKLAKRPIANARNSKNIFMYTNKNGLTNKLKPKINPTIKTYVNKLLDLNQESLKAVQVMEQDCSSVATPGSSIINVEHNAQKGIPAVENKISLEQIRAEVMKHLLDGIIKNDETNARCNAETIMKKTSSRKFRLNRMPRKNSLHKVKSLYISKKILVTDKSAPTTQSPMASSSSSYKAPTNREQYNASNNNKIVSDSCPQGRKVSRSTTVESRSRENMIKDRIKRNPKQNKNQFQNNRSTSVPESQPGTVTSTSPESEFYGHPTKGRKNDSITNISTQTNINLEGELNFVKLAEDKIQNMEKIADLTEKCTQRLSNLAKVLEEVRKHKSLAYSQILSDAASDSDQRSDRSGNKSSDNEPNNDNQNSSEIQLSEPQQHKSLEKSARVNNNTTDSGDYIPFLSNIPKPTSFKPISSSQLSNSSSNSSKNSNSPDEDIVEPVAKLRAKPPPALYRINLKHGQHNVVPHELSTVVEVESPMSVKQKTQTSQSNTKSDGTDSVPEEQDIQQTDTSKRAPDMLNTDFPKNKIDLKYTTMEDSSDDSKIQMIDLKQFNEIMLKPFFSINEFAKHFDIGALDDGSNLDDIVKDDMPNEELSSLHSDGSLPDVISELLKRNLITEPFKFDTGSNVNSTTVSSESTMSVLALSKVRKDKKKSSVMFQNKENIGETSDTLSMSSNPDLENAFKKLGLGWASSTLKKTKERLALSSSSNTSSSSMSQFKLRNFNQDIPALVSDTVSSVLNCSKVQQKHTATDSAKHAEQQTSLTNSMTVKEFLKNELAKKITFNNNKSKSINETEEEFVSLFETKMPEEMKHSSRMVREELSIDNSMRSGNNRARTSTPVQLFKSSTYHSSSSSNLSNGLFSNADELSSVKVTSNSMKHSTSDKDELTIPNFSLKSKKVSSECSRSD